MTCRVGEWMGGWQARRIVPAMTDTPTDPEPVDPDAPADPDAE
jgi:hypothetical protein